MRDEIDTERVWLSSQSYVAPSDDPLKGLRTELARAEHVAENHAARLKHAGTPAALMGAERTVAAVEAALMRMYEQLHNAESNLVLVPCRNPNCFNSVPADHVYAYGGACESCRAKGK